MSVTDEDVLLTIVSGPALGGPPNSGLGRTILQKMSPCAENETQMHPDA
jgi:hypothetical protein